MICIQHYLMSHIFLTQCTEGAISYYNNNVISGKLVVIRSIQKHVSLYFVNFLIEFNNKTKLQTQLF